MRTFPCGPEVFVRERLAAFIEEMDVAGETYGTPGGADCEPNTLGRSHGVVETSDHQIVWLILRGIGEARGNDGQGAPVGPGTGVYWEIGETPDVTVREEPLAYIDVDGPLVTVAKFVFGATP